jgi:sugar (pentulose or hexulose) kinase
MAFIGIDIGTSFIKGAVLDLDGLHIQRVQRAPFPEPIPGLPPLVREFDPQQVMDAVHSLLESLIRDIGECEGLVMCSQMHCMVTC